METRPIYHKCDETIRGHVFCSFLALLLKAELEKRLREREESWEWAEILRELQNLQEVEAAFQGRRYRRSADHSPNINRESARSAKMCWQRLSAFP